MTAKGIGFFAAAAAALTIALPSVVHAQDRDDAHKGKMPLHSRMENQHDRIHESHLTRGQKARVDSRISHIRADARRDRMAHHGKLTPAEHARLEHRMDKTSEKIHDMKRHDK